MAEVHGKLLHEENMWDLDPSTSSDLVKR